MQRRHDYAAVHNTEDEELSDWEIKFLKREIRKRKWVRRLKKASNYIQGLFWMGVASLVIYKTNFFRQVWENPDVNSFFLNVALVAVGFNLMVVSYISIYGPCVLKRDLDLQKDMP